MAVSTISWDNGRVKLIDQTKLPLELSYIYCSDVKCIWDAIKTLKVRGAPAIGIAGAFGVVIGIQHSGAKNFEEFEKELNEVIEHISTSRPTAVNLFWALGRMRKTALSNRDKSISEVKKNLLRTALSIFEEDRKVCRQMALHGEDLLEDGDTVLTHCNAGALATADYGTALGIIYKAVELGKKISVYADETRPLLQGARLTTWELKQAKIGVTLICDNTAAVVMKQGKIKKVLIGADRIASNGDTANKIGSYNLAILAKAHDIPFYVAAPTSTLDLSLSTGKEIPIEERDAEEVTNWSGKRTAPEGIKVYSPAFDITPSHLITAIITEKGIAYPPYEKSLSALRPQTENRIKD
jgi:methylthioribose-1-phosphate isomerase